MNQTNTNSELAFAAYVGFDWADQKHAGALATADGHRESFELDQTPEALDAWATKLRQRFGGQRVAVCLEQSKGPLIYGLMKYEFIVLYPVNPKQAKRFREAMQPSGAKNDPGDAEFILELVLKHRERLHAWQPDDAQTRLIGQLAEDRRSLVDTRTELSNRLKSRLKQYFPLALDILGELTTELAAQFLLRWSTLEELQQEDPDQVAAFYRRQHCYHPKLIAERLQKIAQARPLTNDLAIVQSGRRLVRALATQLLALLEPICHYEQELERLMTQHADAKIFQSLPGAGNAMAPRLLAAFGTDRDRLENSAQMEQISGIAPVTLQSGKTREVRRRWACNRFLRQTFHEFAQHSLAQSAWAKAYYDLIRSRGLKHHAAVRALAFKWIRIIYRCWKDRTLYNEVHYFQQLYKKRSPLLQFMGSAQ